MKGRQLVNLYNYMFCKQTLISLNVNLVITIYINGLISDLRCGGGVIITNVNIISGRAP